MIDNAINIILFIINIMQVLSSMLNLKVDQMVLKSNLRMLHWKGSIHFESLGPTIRGATLELYAFGSVSY